MSNVQFSCMLNRGYVLKANLHDPHFNVISQLVELGYFETARSEPLVVRFRLKASFDGGEYPYAGTREQIAYITKLHTYGDAADMANLEFVGIDPATYLLNRGEGSGKAYRGTVSSVIRQVVNEYARDIELEVSDTTDSEHNRYWMMRQDPKTFINSLLQWSSPLTQSKTQWITGSDGMNLSIKSQGDIKPRERAYYTYWEPKQPAHDSICGWDLVADNTLTLTQTRIITQGISAMTGEYHDGITDRDAQRLMVNDSNTSNKIIAAPDKKLSASKRKTFTKPTGESELRGMTSVPAIPEVYSGGEIGLDYRDYMSGHARRLWLNMTRHLMRCRLKIYGHGEWSSSRGLGTDTVKLLWLAAPRTDGEESTEHFMSGNWLVYGFEHDLRPSGWFTYLHIARFDWNAEANYFPKPVAS